MPDKITIHEALRVGFSIPVAHRSDENNKLLNLIESFEKEDINLVISSTDSCGQSYSDSDDDGTMFEPG
jgi:hypothetical protein